MMKDNMPSKEPSAELRLLAELYVEQHHQVCGLPSGELMSSWCSYLEATAPEVLEQPVIHLVNVIVNAKNSVCTNDNRYKVSA